MPIHPTAIIHPDSKIADNVDIGPHVVIDEHVTIGAGCRIWANAYITGHTTIGENNEIHMGAVIGHWPQHMKYDPSTPSRLEIGSNNVFREQCVIHGSYEEGGKTSIGNNNYFMHQSHVGHDGIVGNHCIFAPCCLLGGHSEVQDGANLSGLTALHQFCRIGRLVMVGGVSRVTQDAPPYTMILGESEVVGLNSVGMRRAGLSPDLRNKIKAAYKVIYHQGNTRPDAIKRLREMDGDEEIAYIADFLETCQRGICRHRKGVGKV